MSEPDLTPEEVAKIFRVNPPVIHGLADLWEQTGGKDGLQFYLVGTGTKRRHRRFRRQWVDDYRDRNRGRTFASEEAAG